MSEQHQTQEVTAVDDVRRVREKIAKQHRGNIHEHLKETNRIFEELRVKLGLKTVRPAPRAKNRDGTRG
jgi:hypothetical protein